jgi:hypothetical protein
MIRRAFISFCGAAALFAQFSAGSFEKNLEALKCDTAVIVKSAEIRDPIHWSPDGKSLGVKVRGRWVRIDLDTVVFKRLKWRNDLDIAGPVREPLMLPLEDRERKSWISADEEHARKIVTNRGIRIDFPYEDDGAVALRVSFPNGGSRILWTTRIEDCQGLVLSPDHRFVAYIAGLQGVIVMKVPQN